MHPKLVEGDTKLVVDALNSNNCNLSRFGHIVNDTHRIIHTFSQWRCVFVDREANQAVHLLAKEATKDVKDRIWRVEISDRISDVVSMELLPSSFDG